MNADTSPRVPDVAQDSDIDAMVAAALSLQPRFERIGKALRVRFELPPVHEDSAEVAPR